MIDKSLVKKRFSKSLKTYDDNAIVQKQMAEKLVDFLPKKEFDSILEIGCATGLLTKQLKSKLSFYSFSANDIVLEAESYIKEIIPQSEFILGDIETINLDKKYDLIISNACLQWCNDIEGTILKLKNSLNEGGILALSVFGKDNIKEINEKTEYINETEMLPDLEINGMGLMNIYIRFKTLYRGKHIFKISNAADGGAIVTIGGEHAEGTTDTSESVKNG